MHDFRAILLAITSATCLACAGLFEPDFHNGIYVLAILNGSGPPFVLVDTTYIDGTHDIFLVGGDTFVFKPYFRARHARRDVRIVQLPGANPDTVFSYTSITGTYDLEGHSLIIRYDDFGDPLSRFGAADTLHIEAETVLREDERSVIPCSVSPCPRRLDQYFYERR